MGVKDGIKNRFGRGRTKVDRRVRTLDTDPDWVVVEVETRTGRIVYEFPRHSLGVTFTAKGVEVEHGDTSVEVLPVSHSWSGPESAPSTV